MEDESNLNKYFSWAVEVVSRLAGGWAGAVCLAAGLEGSLSAYSVPVLSYFIYSAVILAPWRKSFSSIFLHPLLINAVHIWESPICRGIIYVA